jgi:Na+/phosphate symporter
MSTRDAYKKKLEAEIELAQAKLVELKARAKVSAADVRIKYEKSIDHLERMLDVTKTKLGELGSSSEDAWGDLRSGVESAWADFKTGLGDAAAKFRS